MDDEQLNRMLDTASTEITEIAHHAGVEAMRAMTRIVGTLPVGHRPFALGAACGYATHLIDKFKAAGEGTPPQAAFIASFDTVLAALRSDEKEVEL